MGQEQSQSVPSAPPFCPTPNQAVHKPREQGDRHHLPAPGSLLLSTHFKQFLTHPTFSSHLSLLFSSLVEAGVKRIIT